MSLFQRIKKAGESKLGRILLAGTLLTGIGCSHDNEPSNHAPEFTSTPVTTAVENSPYNYDADADDVDTGDILTYSLTQSPTGMTINSSTGLIQWTPTDTQSGVNQNISVKVEDDKGASTTQDYTIDVTNTETISGYVSDAMDGNPLESIDVTVGSFTDTTDSGGHWEIQDVPDGDYSAKIKDPTRTYQTFKPGFFRVGKLEKLTQDAIIYEQIHRGFVDDTIRFNGRIVKWLTKPKFRIYRLEKQSGLDVGNVKINEIKDIIKTELTQFASDSYDFSDSDIEVIDSIAPGGEIPGYIKIKFDNSFTPGYNGKWLNGDEVTGAIIGLNTSSGKNWQLQELTASLIGSGETSDANYSDSVLYGNSTNTFYSDDDLMLSKLMYSDLQRTAGNEDYGTPDNHDRNPDTYQWNMEFTGPR
ncbi:hypothetical protein DRN73_02785 [Candidatus Pacearchaeota archaeon]|nr:MAG: hypothetical protein DRN73_02785 [Candidatus Pacearchaeota archaeon]